MCLKHGYVVDSYAVTVLYEAAVHTVHGSLLSSMEDVTGQEQRQD